MNFIEKDLEDIIYNNFEAVQERGLVTGAAGRQLVLLRQVSLGAYGIADLIQVSVARYSKERYLTIVIIECKLNQVNINTYLQAKRYETAINEILRNYDLSNTTVKIKTCLIGQKIETASDFVYVLNSDLNCKAYTYSYEVNGIHFQRCGNNWGINSPNLEKAAASGSAIFIPRYKQLIREFPNSDNPF